MAIKRVTLTCDWCTDTKVVEAEVDLVNLLNMDVIEGESGWFFLKHRGKEQCFCTLNCLVSELGY